MECRDQKDMLPWERLEGEVDFEKIEKERKSVSAAIVKSVLKRFFWLLNPWRTFQGWCAVTLYGEDGNVILIAATRSKSLCDAKVFYEQPK
jgi:hypothetical protein